MRGGCVPFDRMCNWEKNVLLFYHRSKKHFVGDETRKIGPWNKKKALNRYGVKNMETPVDLFAKQIFVVLVKLGKRSSPFLPWDDTKYFERMRHFPMIKKTTITV